MSDAAAINQATYGGIADSYASKYGIPTDVFRNAINAVSGFDPQFVDGERKGIAGLGFTKSSSPNPADVGSSLDFAARYIASEYKTMGDWTKAASSFTGNLGTADQPQYDAMGNTTGYATPTPDQSAGTGSGGYFGQFTSFMKNSAWTILFSIVGAILIIASLWVLVNSSANE